MASPSVTKIMFDKYDTDKSGSLTLEEFKKLCYDLGHHLSDQEIQLAVKVIDKDGEGKIQYNEFLQWWRTDNKWGKLELDQDQLQRLNQASTYFQYFDKDRTGSLDVSEFKALHADLLRHGLTTKSLESCLEDLDANRDGKVQFNEYIDWLVRIGTIPIKVL